MIYLEKIKILTPLQKWPKSLGKLIVAKGFKNLPKVQLIAQSGHTVHSSKQIVRQSWQENSNKFW